MPATKPSNGHSIEHDLVTVARTLTPDLSTIPPALTTGNQFVAWKFGKVRDGKPEKVPINCTPGPLAGRYASATDATTWTDFATACAYARAHGLGVGRVLAADDELVCVDIDRCRDPATGHITPEAQRTVNECDSYTELSPSQCGLHIWLRGTAPQNVKTPALELWCKARYLSLTGEHLAGTPTTINARQSALDALYARFGKEQAPTPVDAPPRPSARQDAPARRLSDTEIEDGIERARTGNHGEKFCRVFDHGDTRDYPSASEADGFAANEIVNALGPDFDAFVRAMRQSALWDVKWEKRADYRERTFKKALNRTSYHPLAPALRAATGVTVPVPAPTPATPTRGTDTGARFPLLDLDTLLGMPDPPPLVDGLIDEGSGVGFSGQSGHGKSFLALDLACRIAAGVPDWAGRPIRRHGHVVYVAAEGERGIPKRLRAWIAHHGTRPERLHVMAAAPGLTNERDVADVLAAIAGLPEPPVLVVIDTVSQTMGGADENDTKDMQAYADHLRTIRTTTRATLLVLHHTTKAGGHWRGSNALKGAIDTGLTVELHAGGIVELGGGDPNDNKQREHARSGALTFRLTPVAATDSVVPVPVTPLDAALSTVAAMHHTERTALAVLRRAGEAGMTFGAWFDACKAAGLGFSRAAFDRIRSGLLAAGAIRQVGGRGTAYRATPPPA